jgi:3-methyladenine DNA glycosylase AlkD
MPTPSSSPRRRAGGASKTSAAARAAEVLQWLERRGTRKNRDGLARYGIITANAFGVPVGDLQRQAKSLGRDHALALALWDTGWYEARLLAAFVDEPEQVTPAQMDRWSRDFDNWGICDTVIMHLFDGTPHAWRKVDQWSAKKGEFIKRAGFAMLASLALHDKTSGDARFLRTLPLIEAAATDERNFVKKGVNWALRSIGHRSVALHAAAITLAEKLAQSEDPTPRWIGKDALRDLNRPLVRKRVAAKDLARARQVSR